MNIPALPSWLSLCRPEPWPTGALQLPKFQSHRGYHAGGEIENTLAAFREATQRGALICECDVQLSRDQVPVVFHDESLQRLFNDPRLLRDLTVAELKAAGPIPTLQEILTDPTGSPYFNVELKSKKIDDPLARKVAGVVKSSGAQDKVMFSSFNPFALWLMQNALPNVPRALLASGEVTKENAWYLRRLLFAPLLKLHMLNLEQEMLTPKILQFWKAKNMPLSVWTIANAERAKYFLQHGVQSVISDLDPSISLV